MTSYQPVNCEFHDAIESYATLGESVDIVYVDVDGAHQHVREVVADVFANAGEEFLQTKSGLRIRLDQLKSIGPHQLASFG